VKTAGASDPKQRILDEAVKLFARKGYSDVGIRDIARAAAANTAMISYYYGGKVGVLKAVLAAYVASYYEVLERDAEPATSPTVADYVRRLAENLVRFYGDNIELAIAANSAADLDIPEIHDTAMRLNGPHRPMVGRFFEQLGLDTTDAAVVYIVRGFLTNMVYVHFRDRFVREQILAKHPELRKVDRETAYFPGPPFDAGFYSRYAAKLAEFYLGGVAAIAVRPQAPVGCASEGTTR